MKKLYLIFFPFLVSGQINLVPNYSFGDKFNCPITWAQMNVCKNWNAIHSADYYHSCWDSVNNFLVSVSVPSNVSGYQNARTDSAYSGIITESYNIHNVTGKTWAREYLYINLQTPLQSGKTYQVEFYYSFADSVSNVFINNLQVMFTNNPPGINITSSLNYFNKAISDTINSVAFDYYTWNKFSVYYTNTIGGEDWLTIGNIRDTINFSLDTVFNSQHDTQFSEYHFVYFYIDDVSVVCIDCETAVLDISKQFITNYPNPADNYLTIKLDKLEANTIIEIYDISNKLVSKEDLIDIEQTINVSHLNAGIYFYSIKADGVAIKQDKLIISR